MERLAWLQPLPPPREEELKERARLKHEIKTLQHNFNAPLDHLDEATRSVVLEGRLKASTPVENLLGLHNPAPLCHCLPLQTSRCY